MSKPQFLPLPVKVTSGNKPVLLNDYSVACWLVVNDFEGKILVVC